ncbi:ankyrin repeat domain-containing protein [Parashewanella spongiae]|uniref:Ankyrin repeat domain-containing protein n=1 Tax=Parashewanella spongiae TaxID=342950 RepID=A0A3A6U0F2_9GAMM|nr:ankyrin repeat domain-containing protein [Parashewanella spongiae]MCL1079276.1 ankyrin repeat domain-containing protein [Parashewanella spongiae]RJY10432.1 ankyrin repeat domain-containing protein [Parashewanella spongiae]
MKIASILLLSLLAFNSHAKDLIDFVSSGNQVAIDNLLLLGVDPNIEKDNQTPLSASLIRCKNIKNRDGNYYQAKCYKIANQLIKAGADINWKDRNGNNIVMLMAINPESFQACVLPSSTVLQECSDFMQYLRDNGFNFEAKNNDGNSYSNLLANSLNHAEIPDRCKDSPYTCENYNGFLGSSCTVKEPKGCQNRFGQTPIMQRINLHFWRKNTYIDINLSDNTNHTLLTYLLEKNEEIPPNVMDLFIQYLLPRLDLGKVVYNGKTQKQLLEEYYQARNLIFKNYMHVKHCM